MPWFKVDDQLATHPKVAKAGLAAMGLWVKAGSWSAQQGTGGYVPADILRLLGGKPTHAQALVDAGLWNRNGTGWLFRDWTDYQPSATDSKALREERAESGRRGNHARWHAERGRRDPDCKYCLEDT